MSSHPLREIWRKYRRTDLPSAPPPGLPSYPNATERPERHLVTVGIGKPYDDAARRLARQARATGWFDIIHVVDGCDDTLCAAPLLAALEPLKLQHPKGAGLWAWKPALLRKAMATAPENAHVYYIDAGCELSILGGARFEQLDALLSQRSALLFHLPFLEDEWTKPALLTRFPVARGSAQIQATWLGLRKDIIGEALVARWDERCREQDFTWLKDPTSDHLRPVQEHRHDQSVLSCIVKAEFPQLVSEPWEDFFAPWMYHQDSEVLLAPVHALRIRDGGSVLDPLVQASNLWDCLQARAGHPSPVQGLRRVAQRLRHALRDEVIILLDYLKRARQRPRPEKTSTRGS